MRLIAVDAFINFLRRWPSATISLPDAVSAYSTIEPAHAEVNSAEIYRLLKGNAPEAMTNEEIRHALNYSKDHAPLISTRLSSFVRRQSRTGIYLTNKGDRKAWAYKGNCL